jgi:D-sedoheptulose 7-phosphate isomerase
MAAEVTGAYTYINKLVAAYEGTKATNYDGDACQDVIEYTCSRFKAVRDAKRKIMLVGNGGSAAIASHMAIDLSKNARVPAMAFNDASALTCLANDYGYQRVFAEQIQYHGTSGDILVAISSSGASENIINAVLAARYIGGVQVFTFSGFLPKNRLRGCGDINFYVPSDQYGFVELTHQIILHQIVDALTLEYERLAAAELVPSA